MLQTFSYLPVVVHRLNNYANYSTNLQQNYAQKNKWQEKKLPLIKKICFCAYFTIPSRLSKASIFGSRPLNFT